MSPVDNAAADIAANATRLDIAAARQFLDVNAADGRRAAMDTSGAGHLIRKYKINRNLGAICRRIVADHEENTMDQHTTIPGVNTEHADDAQVRAVAEDLAAAGFDMGDPADAKPTGYMVQPDPRMTGRIRVQHLIKGEALDRWTGDARNDKLRDAYAALEACGWGLLNMLGSDHMAVYRRPKISYNPTTATWNVQNYVWDTTGALLTDLETAASYLNACDGYTGTDPAADLLEAQRAAMEPR